ncbi:MAG: peptidoglycan-binding protein [Clostridia bacterium]|nr:peptidoglycan-binding protein [Clostridia bacterium]
MKFSDRVKAFLGDVLDGIACRISTALKFAKKHLLAVCSVGAGIIAAVVLACVFVPRISRAIRDKQASVDPTNEIVLIPTTVPTATPTATPTPTPTPEPTPTPVPLHLANGDRNDIVIDVQLRLMELNYMDYDEPTNYFGKITTEAVKQFQRRNGLEVTGELFEEDYAILMSSRAKLYMASKGDEGTDIAELQKRLHELDYLESVTGVFDDATELAVRDFQEKNELEVDGMVGSQTKEALYSEDAVPFSLYIGSEGEDVRLYQEKLYDLGYLANQPNGIYGEATVRAVKRFQERNAIIVDGHVGPSTKEALMSKNAKYNKIELTMSGLDVYRIQYQLYKLNYMTRSEVTGYFGAKTENAVKAFQKTNKLTVDGTVAKETFQMLFSSDAKPTSRPASSTPEPTKTPKPTATPKPTRTPRPGTTPKPTPKPTRTPKPTNTPKPTAAPGTSTEERIANLIRIAKSKLGCPYVRGAKGPNQFDCSGFVYWCLNKAGVEQSYMTSYQWRFTTRYRRINSMSSIQAGDVIVFKMGAYSGHVAIAAGNGMMVDASSQAGQVVYRTYQTNYWHNVFYCAYRIFSD